MKTADRISLDLQRWAVTTPTDVVLPNFYDGMWEMDLVKITKAGVVTEFEIKVSRSDFKADFDKGKGRKHSRLLNGERLCNRFFFVVPRGLVPIVAIPKHAGLIYYDDGHFEVIKPAPVLHKRRFTDFAKLAHKLAFRERQHREKSHYLARQLRANQQTNDMSTQKSTAWTGLRNGDLFCFNCGASEELPLPMGLMAAAQQMKSFGELHKACPKTWVEPAADATGKTERENADWWLENGERGISSETMFQHLDGRLIRGRQSKMHPSDPDDFGRCYKLLQAVPEFKAKLHLMKNVSREWAALVENWDQLTAMYEINVRDNWKNYKQVGMYKFMKSLGC